MYGNAGGGFLKVIALREAREFAKFMNRLVYSAGHARGPLLDTGEARFSTSSEPRGRGCAPPHVCEGRQLDTCNGSTRLLSLPKPRHGRGALFDKLRASRAWMLDPRVCEGTRR